MSYPYEHTDIRFDVPPDTAWETILRHGHAVMGEIGFVPFRGIANFGVLNGGEGEVLVERYRACAEHEYHRYEKEVAAAKARVPGSGGAVEPGLVPGVEPGFGMEEDMEALRALPLPRLPHHHFGMTNATSREPLPVVERRGDFLTKVEYILHLEEFGMSDRWPTSPGQIWEFLRPHPIAADSVEPGTAEQLWLHTDVPVFGQASGFERYLQLAMQEVAIRLHRELGCRETVGMMWTNGHDPRYPESMWQGYPLFRFSPEGDEFSWDYMPRHYPERMPLFEPHADAYLEAEVEEYERWLKATYCR